MDNSDDYRDFIIPLAKAVAANEVECGIAICASGVGAAIAANIFAEARAALFKYYFSARQGVEDDDMNLICLGGSDIAFAEAQDFITVFLKCEIYRR